MVNEHANIRHMNKEVLHLSNDVVRYNNGLNTVPLRKFSSVEMDLFWSVCSKMKRKGVEQAVFSFEEIKEIAQYSQRGTEVFAEDIKRMADKLGELSFYYEDDSVWDKLMLFRRFTIDKNKETLTVKVSDEFEFILNSIGSNFTRFELENMTKLSSSYTKELYRQLMSHRDLQHRKGAWFVTVEDFRLLLNIPKSYRMSHIDERIFRQAEEEFLTPDAHGKVIFSSFKIEKVKARKGNKISSFRIYFQEPIMCL